MFTQAETRLTVRARLRPLASADRPRRAPDGHARSAAVRAPLPRPLGAQRRPRPASPPWARSAAHVAARLTGRGPDGRRDPGALFDAWSPARAYPHTHGGVRILSETASAELASPAGGAAARRCSPASATTPGRASWNFPAPWPGGTWRLARRRGLPARAPRCAVLEHAAPQPGALAARLFLGVNRRACDLAVALRVRRSRRSRTIPWPRRACCGSCARAGWRCSGRAGRSGRAAALSRPGSHVVRMQQPASAFAKTAARAPALPRPAGSGRAARPVARTTSPRTRCRCSWASRWRRWTRPSPPISSRSERPRSCPAAWRARDAFYALGHGTASSSPSAGCCARGWRWTGRLEAFDAGGGTRPAGTLLVPAAARDRLEPLARELGFAAHGVAARPPALRLRRPRVGLYQSWVPSMDEGWTRFVFEKEAGIDYETLHDLDVRAGRLRGALRRDRAARPAAGRDPERSRRGHDAGRLRRRAGRVRDGGAQGVRSRRRHPGGAERRFAVRDRSPRSAGEECPRRRGSRRLLLPGSPPAGARRAGKPPGGRTPGHEPDLVRVESRLRRAHGRHPQVRGGRSVALRLAARGEACSRARPRSSRFRWAVDALSSSASGRSTGPRAGPPTCRSSTRSTCRRPKATRERAFKKLLDTDAARSSHSGVLSSIDTKSVRGRRCGPSLARGFPTLEVDRLRCEDVRLTVNEMKLGGRRR